MQSTKEHLLVTDFPAIARNKLTTLQVNLGYTCNLSCSHCHVNAGPNRREQMDLSTINQVIAMLTKGRIDTLDLTGGAPEMNPHFRYLVTSAVALGVAVIDRCNLTILKEPNYQWLLPFLAEHNVSIVASLPCYSEANVEQQRGKGVFDLSIEALQALNAKGYGQSRGQDGREEANDKDRLALNLVYNPTANYLPPAQQQLERDYKRELGKKYHIVFDHLYTITNMPISRFGAVLLAKGEYDNYMQLLKDNFSSENMENLMCKSTLSVDWQGYLYDCDFNQMLELPIQKVSHLISGKQRLHLNDFLDERVNVDLNNQPIITADHCYGCTAGQGSSCGGALN